ncbi:hypothetical protein [Marinicellulosiphila megalodicopiae]|uniref:hypothetical protein n=1 Tax=Marinicellulosiphila megalodicopiae TaxID=2724896 RepID=UPI003BAF0E7E
MGWSKESDFYFSAYFYSERPPAGLGWNPGLPTPTFTKIGNQFLCDKKVEDFINPASFPNKLYVDIDATGAGDGSSWVNAYNSIYDALLAVEASGVATRILVMSGIYDYGFSTTQSGNITYMNVDYTLEAMHGRVTTLAGATGDHKSWALEGSYTDVWVSTITQSIRGYDFLSKMYLKPVNSIAEVAETPNSIYVNGSLVYVRRLDGTKPDRTLFVIRNFPGVGLGGKAKCLIRNFDGYGGKSGTFRFYEDTDGNGVPTITESWGVLDNCTAQYAMSGEFDDVFGVTVFSIEDWTLGVFFNCTVGQSWADGFAGSVYGDYPPHILAVGCKSVGSGTNFDSITPRQSCNGITMHGGAKLAEIGGYFSGSVGSNVGHVDEDTRAWHFGTKAGDSDGDKPNNGGLEWGAFGVWGSSVTMWLSFCTDFGSPIGVMKSSLANCYIRNHSGTGTISDGVVVLPEVPYRL